MDRRLIEHSQEMWSPVFPYNGEVLNLADACRD
jgi:hypothetical protein